MTEEDLYNNEARSGCVSSLLSAPVHSTFMLSQQVTPFVIRFVFGRLLSFKFLLLRY